MAANLLTDRDAALGDTFFGPQDALRKQLRESFGAKDARETLAAVSGIRNEELLRKLVVMGLAGDTLAALSIVPLVAVAWADGRLNPKEREAVLQGAAEAGLGSDSLVYPWLLKWLEERPTASVLRTWREYIQELAAQKGFAALEELRAEVLGRARKVANAAGGFLGLGSRISAHEEAVLAELNRAFEPDF